MKSKKAQFFMIALVLIALMFLVVFSYFRSSEEAGVVLFESSSEIELRNIANTIETKNNWLGSTNWWNASWKYRKQVSIASIGSNPVEVNISLASNDQHISDCDNEIRVVNTTPGYRPANVSSNTPPCTIIFHATVGTYYVYYGNSNAGDVANISSGTAPTYTVGAEETSQVCDHLMFLYQSVGRSINCSVPNLIDAQTVNYSVKFYAPDIKFEGYMN